MKLSIINTGIIIMDMQSIYQEIEKIADNVKNLKNTPKKEFCMGRAIILNQLNSLLEKSETYKKEDFPSFSKKDLSEKSISELREIIKSMGLEFKSRKKSEFIDFIFQNKKEVSKSIETQKELSSKSMDVESSSEKTATEESPVESSSEKTATEEPPVESSSEETASEEPPVESSSEEKSQEVVTIIPKIIETKSSDNPDEHLKDVEEPTDIVEETVESLKKTFNIEPSKPKEEKISEDDFYKFVKTTIIDKVPVLSPHFEEKSGLSRDKIKNISKNLAKYNIEFRDVVKKIKLDIMQMRQKKATVIKTAPVILRKK